MRVIHVISTLDIGGAQKLLTELLPAQRNKSVDVEILVYHRKNNFLEKQLTLNGITIHSLDIENINSPRIFFRLHKLIKKYDIVHVHLFPTLYQVAIASFGLNSTLIYTEHSTHNKRRNHKYLRLLEILIYRKYTAIVGISQQTSDNLKKWLKWEKVKKNSSIISTINNGINLKVIKSAQPLDEYAEKKIILMVSRFTKSKDQGTLIKTLPLISNPRILVAFAGEGETLDENKRLAKQLGVSMRCLFLGSRNDVPNLINSAWLGVQSSNWEGFGLTAVEFMAAGKPIIASDVEGLKQVVEGAGMLFSANDYMGLARCINALDNDSTLYQEISKKCEKRAMSYSVDTMANQYNNLYNSLLSCRKY